MVTFLKLNNEGDVANVVVGDKMFMIIKRNDKGISIDYYSYATKPPFKSEQISFDDIPEKP